jgi:hypothetical protein
LLERLEPGPGDVDRGAQDRERQGQDHLIGGHGRGALALPDGQGDAAAALAHGDELAAGLDLPVQLGGEPGRKLVAARSDGVLLVGRAENAQLPLAGEAEQIHQVQGALLAGVGAVLNGVGDLQQLAEPGAGPARDRLVDTV